MGDYDPKNKLLPTSWRTIRRRLPKTLSTFQLVILAGFVSLLILRSSVGIRNYNFAVREERPLDQYLVETELQRNLDLNVEPKRQLPQQAKKSELELDNKEPSERVVRKKSEVRLPEDELVDQILDEEAVDVEVSEEDVDQLDAVGRLVKEPKGVENFKEVEAELAEEETLDERAEFDKIKADKSEKVGTQKKADKKTEQKRTDEKIVSGVVRDNIELAKLKDEKQPAVTEKVEKQPTVTDNAEQQLPVKETADIQEAVNEDVEKKEAIEEEQQTIKEKVDEERIVTAETVGEEGNAEKIDEPEVAVDSGPEKLTEEMVHNLRRQAMENMTRITRRDDAEAFTMGPKISDWDEQREAWFEKNPHMRTTDPHKPKALLVTGSQPWPCRSPVGDHYLLKMLKNKVDYARTHEIDIFYNFAHLDKQMSHFWAKLPLIRKMMLTHPETEWIFWMDSDAIFTDMVFEIPFEKYSEYNIVMWGYNEGIYDERSWVACNTGVFFLRNNQWTLDLLDMWVHMGPEGEIRNEAGKILTTYLTSRPEMMADDQSALVFLMLTQEELRPKIHLEWEYWLSGYWGAIVDKYEEYVEKSHPGVGGQDWPFTTHFTGCQPCSGNLNPRYAEDKCLSGMERAFNFADNQVLRSFGYEHENLYSSLVRRMRNETSDPLASVPTINPWSVESFY